jgi:hypothetical protein
MAELFINPDATCDPYFIDICKDQFSNQRALLEYMWRNYYMYADADYAKEIRVHFFERIWELMLGSILLTENYQLQTKRNSGEPDFSIDCTDKVIRIEATISNCGINEGNKVPGFQEWEKDKTLVDEFFCLRLTNSLTNKLKQCRRFIENRKIDEKDPYIIALYGRQLPTHFFEGEVPRIVQVLFGNGGVGKYVISSEEVITGLLSPERAITKESGEKVVCNLFDQPRFEIITGVLYCDIDIFEFTDFKSLKYNTLANFTFIENPNAINKINQKSLLHVGSYWQKNKSVVTQLW